MTEQRAAEIEALDDFAGAGGWDEGARMLGLATTGVENDRAACLTAIAAGHERIHDDVREADVASHYRGYLASPPCTDFSSAGRQQGEAGKTGHLVRFPLARALELRPEWLAWEQVAEVLPVWRQSAHRLREVGYSVWTGIVDAADYGVPQNRRRAVLLASRRQHMACPTPTHTGQAGDMLTPLPEHLTLADVLGLEPGWVYDSGQNSVMGGGKIQRYVRSCDRPAGTLTTKAASQWTLRRGDERRKLSINEAAALQTFRPGYPWQGTREQQLRQIGNAVPPRLAAHLIATATGRTLKPAELVGCSLPPDSAQGGER